MFTHKLLLIAFALIIICNGCDWQNEANYKSIIRKVELLNKVGFQNDISKKDIEKQLEKENDSLNALIYLLQEKGYAIIIDQNDVIGGSPVFYATLFDKLNSINKQFKYTSFATELAEGEDFDFYYDKASYIEFTSNNSQYNAYFYFDDAAPVSADFYSIANRALADADAPGRYYGVHIFCHSCSSDYYVDSIKVDNNKFGIVSLSKEQAQYIIDNKLLSLTESSHDILTTAQVNRLTRYVLQSGLCYHCEKDYIQHKLKEINYSAYTSYEDVFQNFDSLTCVVTREAWSELPYLELLECMQYISQGQFNPTQIQDSFVLNHPSILRFKLKNASLSYELINVENHIDLSIILSINNYLDSQNSEGKFYFIEPFENEGYMVYLTNKQFNDLTEQKLLKILNVESIISINTDEIKY